MPRRSGNEVVTIYWRDIPAQVNGQAGRDRHQILLSTKFQRAVDRAKRKAGIYTADEDIAQWRRVSVACDGDAAAAAADEAARLEAEYSREQLGRLAYAGGFEADVDEAMISLEALRALEELDDDDDGSTRPARETDSGPSKTRPASADGPTVNGTDLNGDTIS